jgi:hypothetical protein
MRIRTRNAVNLLGLETADWGQTPTEFQRSLYPERYRRGISVIHEGVDTALVRPEPSSGCGSPEGCHCRVTTSWLPTARATSNRIGASTS